MEFRYKLCDESNSRELSQIARQTFIDAFEQMNNPEDFYYYVNRAFSEEQIITEIQTSGSRFFLVYKDKELIGYVKLNIGKAQTEAFGDKFIELERIYISKHFQNRGIGMKVLEYMIKLAQDEKFEFLWLGVWQENLNAVRFYKKKGFEIFDTHPYYIGKDKQTDWLMKLDLTKDLSRTQ